MTIVRVGRRNVAKFTFLNSFCHECKLRAVYNGRGTPDAKSFGLRQIEQFTPFFVSVGHRLFAPNMMTGHDSLFVKASMLLHVRKCYHHIKLRTCKHLVNMRIPVRNVIFLRSSLGALWYYVAR